MFREQRAAVEAIQGRWQQIAPRLRQTTAQAARAAIEFAATANSRNSRRKQRGERSNLTSETSGLSQTAEEGASFPAHIEHRHCRRIKRNLQPIDFPQTWSASNRRKRARHHIVGRRIDARRAAVDWRRSGDSRTTTFDFPYAEAPSASTTLPEDRIGSSQLNTAVHPLPERPNGSDAPPSRHAINRVPPRRWCGESIAILDRQHSIGGSRQAEDTDTR
jgi:hypothetical protein